MIEEGKTQLEGQTWLEGLPALRQMMENIQQVVWLLDLGRDQIVYVSPAYELVWGRSCASLYADALTLIKSIHPEDRVKVLSARTADYHRPLDQSYRIVRPDGSLRWISAHTFLLGEESAEAAYQVCVAQDVTNQNQVDQTLLKALARSREQFNISRRMSLARKPEAVLNTLMSASSLRSAQRASVLFFASPIGHPLHEIEVVAAWSSVPYRTSPHPNEVLNEAGLFEDLALMDLIHPVKPVIVSQVAKDQRLTPAVRDLLLDEQIQSLATFSLVAIGKWSGCLVVFFPEEKHFELVELRHIKVLVDQAAITLYNLQLLEIEAESRHEAERANEIKTRFLAMISHELRTPLTSIKGFTSTLLAEDVSWDAKEQRDFVLTIEQEANRLQELIDHLLDLSRLEAGMLPITLEPHTLQEIIADALPQFHSLTSQQTLTIYLPDHLPPVYADARRIAQVLVNLVRNAATYAPKGTEISISASVRGGFVQVSVVDHGPGIPPAERKWVFQAFRRGSHEENGTGKGAGLGLAICKGLIEAHGGRIWIKKQNAPGTTIAFTLPLARVQEVEISRGEEKPDDGKYIDR